MANDLAYQPIPLYDEQKNRILSALSNGKIAPVMPEGWLAVYKALLTYSNMPPAVAAECIGIPYSAVLNYLKTTKDADLKNKIDTSLEAYYITELQKPYENQKSHQILALGIKALTKMLDKENQALPLDQDELEKIKEARKRFIIELKISDENEIKTIEQNKHRFELSQDSDIAEDLDIEESKDVA